MIDALHQDADALGIERPGFEPRATDYVPQMLSLIGRLVDQGLAYPGSDGDVNYAVRKFPSYGRLSGKSLDDLRAGERVAVAEGKETKNFDGQDYILERGIVADLAIVKGWKADTTGNVMFRKTARNFNVPAATCGKVCVVEVEELVEPGQLDPDKIHLPGVYVQRLIVGAPYDKKIEQRTVRQREAV
jgi:hypothetical protein